MKILSAVQAEKFPNEKRKEFCETPCSVRNIPPDTQLQDGNIFDILNDKMKC